MSTKTVIGRRELFAWIERHTKVRLHDYTDLADGSVFCVLFSLVFSKCKIRPVAAPTHSHSQRAQVNWSNLKKGMSLLGLPSSLIQRELIDPVALGGSKTGRLQQDEQHSFCAMALFYFLYHVGKQPGFTAEFSKDLSDEVADFLQSMESIQSLVLGGGIEIGSVPEPLRSAILQAVKDPSSINSSSSRSSSRERSSSSSGNTSRAPSAGRPSASETIDKDRHRPSTSARTDARSALVFDSSDEHVKPRAGSAVPQQWHDFEEVDISAADAPMPPPRLSPQKQQKVGAHTMVSDANVHRAVRFDDEEPHQQPSPTNHHSQSSEGPKVRWVAADARRREAEEISALQAEVEQLRAAVQLERRQRIQTTEEKDAKIHELHVRGVQLLEQTNTLRSELEAAKEATERATLRAQAASDERDKAIRSGIHSAAAAAIASTSPGRHSRSQSASSQRLDQHDYQNLRRSLVGAELPSIVMRTPSAVDSDSLADHLPSPSLEAMSNVTGNVFTFDPVVVATELGRILDSLRGSAPPSTIAEAKDKVWVITSGFQAMQSRVAASRATLESLVADRSELLSLVSAQQKEMDGLEAEVRGAEGASTVANKTVKATRDQMEALLADQKDKLNRMSHHHRRELLKVYQGLGNEEEVTRLKARDAQWKVLCASLRRLRSAQSDEEVGYWEGQAAGAVERLTALEPSSDSRHQGGTSPSVARAEADAATIATMEAATINLQSALDAAANRAAMLELEAVREGSLRAACEAAAKENDEANAKTCAALRSKVQALLDENCTLEMRARQASQALTEVKTIWTNSQSRERSMGSAGRSYSTSNTTRPPSIPHDPLTAQQQQPLRPTNTAAPATSRGLDSYYDETEVKPMFAQQRGHEAVSGAYRLTSPSPQGNHQSHPLPGSYPSELQAGHGASPSDSTSPRRQASSAASGSSFLLKGFSPSPQARRPAVPVY